MSYSTNVVSNYQTAEYGKFVQYSPTDTRYPAVSVTRVNYLDSTLFAPGCSYPPVSSVDVYPKYAVLSYIANPEDFNITLSASNVDIGNVGVIDHSTGNDVFAQITQIDTVGLTRVGAVTVKTYGTTPVSGSITVLNPVTALQVTNTVTISGGITVLNPVTSLTISNPVTSLNATITNTAAISGSVTILNPVSTIQVTGNVATTFNPTQVDAFNRLRVSNALTLFDSSHRYRDNNLWSTLSAGGGSVAFNLNQGLMDLNVTNAAGASALRETTKVFAYQPGKSLLVMNTFVMAASATGLVQRVGYFGNENGIYFEMENDAISFVERSIVTSSLVNTVTPRSSWNGDKLDGTGPSGITLDLTKAQIMWMDIEWLGVGTIRTGFIINGQFITCHSFHHANIINSTYITTASLPLRYEIFNKSATSGSKTLKQICSTVISEGGYELRGLQQAISIPISAARTFAATSTYYPIISLRLKTSPNRLDAIVILTALSILGQGNGINYNWQVIASGTTTGGSWTTAGVDSSVDYNITGTSFTGGRILASGFLNASNQASPNLDILKEALFKFQLERNIFTSTPFELTLVAATDTTSQAGLFASMDWEEVSR